MQVDVKVMLKDLQGKPFMGIGVLWLLEGIDRHRSINGAAREMDLSYPKALRLIKNLERGIGHEVVVRHRGGASRGGAELTPVGRTFLRRFDQMQEDIRQFATRTFEQAFAEPLDDGVGG